MMPKHHKRKVGEHKWARCCRCEKRLDPFDGDNASVGMLLTACGPCGKILIDQQDEKIKTFTQEAEKSGLKMSWVMDKAGNAILIAKSREET